MESFSMTVDQSARLLREVRRSIASKAAKPAIVVDGIQITASSVLRSAAIALSALSSERFSSVYYLCLGSAVTHQILEAIGARPLLLKPESTRNERIADRILERMPSSLIERFLHSTRFRTTRIGNYIADTLIRNNRHVYSVRHASRQQIVATRRQALNIAKCAHKAFEEIQPGCVTLSHRHYNQFGIPGAVALGMGIPVVANQRSYFRRCTTVEEFQESEYSLSPSIVSWLRDSISEQDGLTYAASRFRGDGLDMDSENAFGNNRRLTRAELLKECGLPANKPVAVIMAHAFSDAPHGDSWMLYPDYYTWFRETISLIERMPHVNWIVKPHPSTHMYFEDGVARTLLSKQSHVVLAPSGIRTDSVLNAVDAIVTVRGTAALEGLYFGTTGILCGAAWYDSLDSLVSCRSVDAYRTALEAISIRKPDVSSAFKADVGRALFYRFGSYDYFTPAFGRERNPGLSEEAALAHDSAVLVAFNRSFSEPREYWQDPFVSAVRRFFSGNKERLSVFDFKGCGKPDIPLSIDIPASPDTKS